MKKDNAYLDSFGIIKNFLALLASTFEAHSVVLFMPESENSLARLVSYFSMDESSIDKNAQIPQGKGLVGWILKHKEPLIFQIPEENQANLGYYNNEVEDSIHSFIGTFVAGNGALCLDSKKYNFFSENQQKLLDLYAKMIPQLFEIINYKSNTAQLTNYFHLLDNLADLKKHYSGWSPYLRKLLQILSTSLGFEYVAFTSLSGKKDHFYIDGEFPQMAVQQEYSFNGGLVGWVYKNEELIQNDGKNNTTVMPLYSKNDELPTFLASVCIPIKVEKSVAAVLCLASATEKDFSNEFRIVARVISEDLAQFLEIVALKYRLTKATTKKE